MKSELVIVKGQEFKISVQDTIKEDDIFIEQYKQAADMLDAILSENQDSDKNKNNTIHLWQQTEYENNIIAFCGDRGDGKSSAMLTFINALCCKDDHKEDDEIELFKNRIDKKTYIAEPIVIDPSQFDDVHNVLDIVLAKMYKNFNDKYQKDNRESDESKALDLLKRFQKVYRQIAMIYDQQKILDKEFDYEGNIDKLAKLGESTNLKSDFENLIIQYLEFMNNKAEISKSQLLIAIDDLDLCNQVAYKLAEQIRKYLIIPHVVIVMAVKNDQLQLAMQEKNINEYKAVIQYTGKFDNKETSNELDFEIKNMAERYVSKLIPKARRIYMPKMRNISETKISYKEKVDDKEKIIWDSNEDTLVKSVLELIHEKTGMIFLEEDTGMSYLVPDNLRDLINWISQLTKMKSVEKKRKNRNKDEEESEMEDNNLEKDGKLIEKIKKENIDKFYEIFISDWVDRELPWGWKKRFNTLEGMDVIHINANVKKMIEPLFDWDEINKAQFEQMFRWHGGERAVEFFEIMYYFENFNNNIFDIEREKILYAIKCIYTIKFNQARLAGSLFKPEGYINGYIWGETFRNTIPSVAPKGVIDRSRFALTTRAEYNVILKSYFKEGKVIDEQTNKVSKIGDEDKEKYLKCWLLIGLLANTYETWRNQPPVRTFSRTKIIAGNNQLLNYVENSMENYLVSLGNVDVLFDKINLEQIGINRKDDYYRTIIEKIKSNNEKSILCAQKIASNVDVAMQIRKYCLNNNDYKGGTKSEFERSEKLAEVFLENIADFMKTYIGLEIELEDLKYFKFDEGDKVDICELYAQLVEEAIKEQEKLAQQNVFNKGYDLTQKFKDKITADPSNYKEKLQKVSGHLRNTSAENAKSNLDSLADNIQRYRALNNKLPKDLKVEELCDYYSRVIQLYLSDKNMELSKEMCEKYKDLAKIQQIIENDLK